jgi:hypothetical protein
VGVKTKGPGLPTLLDDAGVHHFEAEHAGEGARASHLAAEEVEVACWDCALAWGLVEVRCGEARVVAAALELIVGEHADLERSRSDAALGTDLALEVLRRARARAEQPFGWFGSAWTSSALAAAQARWAHLAREVRDGLDTEEVVRLGLEVLEHMRGGPDVVRDTTPTWLALDVRPSAGEFAHLLEASVRCGEFTVLRLPLWASLELLSSVLTRDARELRKELVVADVDDEVFETALALWTPGQGGATASLAGALRSAEALR